MKKLLLLLLIAPMLFFSCDKIDELNTVTFDETLSLDIPVSVAAQSAIVVKSTAEHTFSETETASLSDIPEIKDYLSKIEEIEVNSVNLIFGGLSSDEEIIKVDFFTSLSGTTPIATLENITSSNNTFSIPKANLVAVGTLLSNTKAVSITVSGTTSKSPMDFTVQMDIDTHIIAKAL